MQVWGAGDLELDQGVVFAHKLILVVLYVLPSEHNTQSGLDVLPDARQVTLMPSSAQY